ncbi:MAG: hypothetical protein PCFJNLEI_01415 [Verrucomicrobiae bacterium]|nr:hypothetical protein [Verrucomicrobiae bacterium]
MKKITSLLTAAALLMAAHPSTASVTLNLDVENLYGPTAGVPAAAGSTVVLIGSTQNATFGDLTQATNSFTAEADDIVLGIFELSDGGIFQNAAFLDIDTTTAAASGLSLNDPLLLLWYPNLSYTPTLTGPGNSQLFGTYRTANATLGSDIGWTVPANGTYTLAAFAESIGGDVPDTTFTATQTTAGGAANTPPSAACQDVIVSAAANCQASVTAAQVNNGSSDPDGDPITLSLAPVGPFALGTNHVTLTVADNKGGTNTCVAKVIVRDTTLPTITCPSNISTQLAPGQVSVVLNFPAPTTGDNCGVASVVSIPASGSSFAVGSTIVTNRVVDSSGNTNLCTFTVSVAAAANRVPNAICQDVIVSAAANCQATVTAAQVNNGSSDPDGDPITLGLAPVGPFALGTNNVTLTVADNKGGTNTCVAKVIVRDTTLPTITCPSNISTQLAPGQVSVIINFPAPTTGDNCGVASVTSVSVSGSSFAIGSTIVTNRVVDNSGNTNLCTFTVTVNAPGNQAPLAVCQDVVVLAGANCQASVTAAQVNNGSSDPDGDPITLGLSPAGPFALGTNNVTLTVADNKGGTNTCVAKVIVRDTTLPTITCPADVSVNVPAGQTSAVVTFPAAQASDACGLQSVTSSPASGSTFPLGQTTVTSTAVDNAGNLNTCTFTVTVTQTENQPPVALCRDVTVTAGANCSANVTAAQVDNGSNDPDGTIASRTLSPAGPYALGQTLVTLTVVDNLGATNSCTATITVEDKTAPTVNCPANVNVQASSNETTAVVTFALPTGADNCGAVTVSALPASGSAFALGVTPVVIMAVDNAGNTNTCSFTVTVTAGQSGECRTIAALIEKVDQLPLTTWRKKTLVRHLELVQRHQQAGRTRAAQAHMEIFVRSVRWLDWYNQISDSAADELIKCAKQIIPFRDGKRWSWDD